jgi:hypothetical protein
LPKEYFAVSKITYKKKGKNLSLINKKLDENIFASSRQQTDYEKKEYYFEKLDNGKVEKVEKGDYVEYAEERKINECNEMKDDTFQQESNQKEHIFETLLNLFLNSFIVYLFILNLLIFLK